MKHFNPHKSQKYNNVLNSCMSTQKFVHTRNQFEIEFMYVNTNCFATQQFDTIRTDSLRLKLALGVEMLHELP